MFETIKGARDERKVTEHKNRIADGQKSLRDAVSRIA